MNCNRLATRKDKITGNPDPKHVSTSYVERVNLTMRMAMRRFTRLTNAFSKKLENHAHMVALYALWYNFVRIHKTLRVSPAMAAGIESLALVDGRRCPARRSRRPPAKRRPIPNRALRRWRRMPVFISYNRGDSKFVDALAKNLVMHRHNIWLDRWEMNIGDLLIEKIQGALTEFSAILVIISKASVASEWCKKELNSGLVRELAEKKVLLLPCVIDDCEIPLFLREKLYADFRTNPDEAFSQANYLTLLRITSQQQGRLESPDFHTDWAYDWKQGKSSGLWYFDWMFVDHGPAIEYCLLTQCQMACNEVASEIFQQLSEPDRQDYIRRALSLLI